MRGARRNEYSEVDYGVVEDAARTFHHNTALEHSIVSVVCSSADGQVIAALSFVEVDTAGNKTFVTTYRNEVI